MRYRRSAEKCNCEKCVHSADELSVQQVERIKIAVKHRARTRMWLAGVTSSQPSMEV